MAPSRTRGPPSFPKQARVVSIPPAYVAADDQPIQRTIVKSTINPGGYHGNCHCHGLLSRRVRDAGGVMLFFPYDEGIRSFFQMTNDDTPECAPPHSYD